MPLAPDTTLGPYRILALLGAGGMGEVYRARDERLGRDVAIKVLPAAFANDPERLGRFEQEARAAGTLSHPNVLTIFDIGTASGTPYIVCELLDGQNLRDVLAIGPIAPQRAAELAAQVAAGLGAAHDRGIVHRDLKPENLFVMKGDRIKILDFGVAKLVAPEEGRAVGAADPTVSARTTAGTVLGTVGYMSPEQLRGESIDGRSDVFSLGCILYEMLQGARAFSGASAVEVMSAILKDEPVLSEEIPQDLAPVLRRCLAKGTSDRFRSAHDLEFVLRQGLSTNRVTHADRPNVRFEPPRYRALTFQRGDILDARLGPDGETVVYAADRPLQVLVKRPESPEAIPLPLPPASVLSISAKGELALKLGPKGSLTGVPRGMLATAPLFGGAPRQVLADVQEADWAPDGQQMAVVRAIGGTVHLEYPIGNRLYVSDGNISFPRVSRDGAMVAFADNPLRSDDRGSICIVDRSGTRRELSGPWPSVSGVAWSARGDEVWFSAASAGVARNLHAVSLTGETRSVATAPGGINLIDVMPSGRVLLMRRRDENVIWGLAPGQSTERPLSWLTASVGADVSGDGTLLLFAEQSEAVGDNYETCIRGMDGSPVVRLGEGQAVALSPDKEWAIARLPVADSPIFLIPTGPGERRTIPFDGAQYGAAAWMPDGRSIVYRGRESGHEPRLYWRDLAGGKPRAISPEGVHALVGSRSLAVSPDGRYAAALGPEGSLVLYPIEGGAPVSVPNGRPNETPLRWAEDGHSLFVGEMDIPVRVSLIDTRTGERRLWKALEPPDPVGLRRIVYPTPSTDGRAYAYTCMSRLGDLYIADGIR